MSIDYGEFGGCFVPEALWTPLREIAAGFEEAIADEAFLEEERRLFLERVGRPTALTLLERFSGAGGGAQIWAKREDLAPGGSFCALSAMAQGLIAKRMGRKILIGESASGDFGVALGSVGAALGLEVKVLMKRDDIAAEPLNAARMRKLGVDLITAEGNIAGRRQAMAQALRLFASFPEESFYATSSLASPDPYPTMLERALSMIGRESRRGLRAAGVTPEYVIAPVGSGSFAAGLFSVFLETPGPQLVGVQAGGDESGARGADSLVRGRPGVYLGTRSLVLQDEEGQIETTHTASAGLAMPVAGPQHARWLKEGAVHYVTVSDEEARQARDLLTETEGIFASLESGYGLAYALKLAKTLSPDEHLLVGITGNGIRELGSLLLSDDEGKS